MNTKKNPYATVSGGKIEAPYKAEQPKATIKTGDDLRVGGKK
jgi:hypothetical protein